MKLETLRAVLRDSLTCLAAGLILALGVALILFLAGLLINGFDLRSALVVVRGGLLVTGAAELLVVAGLILSKKDSNRVRNYGQWKRRFRIFGLLPVLLITAFVVISLGSAVDYYLYF